MEIDPDLIVPAEQYLQSKGLEGRYNIIQGDLMKMDLPDNTFDFAFARFVFQHLRDPRGALSELRRVLKPGGKLVIHDIDIGLGEIVEPQNAAAEAIEARLHEFGASVAATRVLADNSGVSWRRPVTQIWTSKWYPFTPTSGHRGHLPGRMGSRAHTSPHSLSAPLSRGRRRNPAEGAHEHFRLRLTNMPFSSASWSAGKRCAD